MKVIDTPPVSTEPNAREMTQWELLLSNTKYWLIRQRRKLPYLVWWSDGIMSLLP